MILRQFLDTYPVVAASYLVGCGGRGVAAVIDPLEGIERYLEAADSLGMRIRYVIDTHVHADHLSSGRALAEAAAADYVLWAGVASAPGTRGVDDGESLEIGNVRLAIWHTPGHTPEHLSLLVTDGKRGPEPWSVFTGHTLMVGDMGRTELAGSGEEGARQLYRSARRLAQLPDHVEVLPGAFSGSVCGRGLSGKPWSTIGFERRFNRAFRLTEEAEFVSYMLRDTPPPPAGAAETRARNLGATLQEA
ncbi:MAG TPA: MBL fold metallo-hydrolase [Longimicrobiales bacterium]|nr:MBL fold metallo-hydrolase [Longimicrobiales bacterium]